MTRASPHFEDPPHENEVNRSALLALTLAGCIVVPAHTVHVPAVVVY